MKKRFLVLTAVAALMVAMTACGSSDSAKDDSDKKDSKKKNKIVAVKEEDAVIDFDGVELPIDITYQEFLEFMEENDWEWTSAYGEDEDELPNEAKGDFDGGCYLNTNCGRVYVFFMDSEDKSCSVFRYVRFEQDDISVSGITIDTPVEKVAKVLELESEYESGISFYLDDHLTVTYVDDNFLNEGYDCIFVERTFFHMR